MNLRNKKLLVARTLGVGVNRIIFRRIDDIKEAITKQDIRDMIGNGAIMIKNIKGKRKKELRKRRSAGKIKKKIRRRKQNYVKITRKLRNYAKQLLMQGKLNKETYRKLRKQIKSKIFRSKSHFKELLSQQEK